MREILFHGKRLSDGKWVEGDFEHFFTAAGIHCYVGKWGERPNEVDPDTVGEFSGKHDKNNRRIFEGDIVDGLFRDTTPLRAVCAFKDGAFGLAWTHGGVDHFSAFTSICNVEYEVVGNIYDNPELLEVEE